jgi:hypothetical protein
VLGDGDADGHFAPTAVSRLPPAVATPLRADTVSDTELTLGWEARLDAAVCSLSSADFRAPDWAWYSPFAWAVNPASVFLTLSTSDLISSPEPLPTLTWVRLRSEARKASASAHSAALAVAVDDAAAEVAGGLLGGGVVVLLPELQAAVTSPAPSTTAAIFHQAGLAVVSRLTVP